MRQLAQRQAPTLVGEDHSPELMAISKRINTYTLNTDTLDIWTLFLRASVVLRSGSIFDFRSLDTQNFVRKLYATAGTRILQVLDKELQRSALKRSLKEARPEKIRVCQNPSLGSSQMTHLTDTKVF
jgi:hypothetical protein